MYRSMFELLPPTNEVAGRQCVYHSVHRGGPPVTTTHDVTDQSQVV